MFVGLIDTRPRFEPEPDPEPRERPRALRVPWRALLVLAVVVALFKASSIVGGLAGYGLLLVAVTVLSLAIERSGGYRAGLTEHRQ